MTTTEPGKLAHVQHDLARVRLLVQQDRRRGLAELVRLFDAGVAPDSALRGRFMGQFEAFKIGPGISQLGESVDRTWRPWQGKTFAGVEAMGDNRLRHNTFPLVRLLAPTYNAFKADTRTTYRAFPFRTCVAPGRDNPAQSVLKIDYNLPVNPGWSVRRILDELVQIDEGVFLGKAYVKWWWGAWQQWAFFSLNAMLPG